MRRAFASPGIAPWKFAKAHQGDQSAVLLFVEALRRDEIPLSRGIVRLSKINSELLFGITLKHLRFSEEANSHMDARREAYALLRAELDKRKDVKNYGLLDHLAIRAGITEARCFCGRKGLYVVGTYSVCSTHRMWSVARLMRRARYLDALLGEREADDSRYYEACDSSRRHHKARGLANPGRKK